MCVNTLAPEWLSKLTSDETIDKDRLLEGSFPKEFLSYRLGRRVGTQPSNGNFLRFEFSDEMRLMK